MCKIRFAFKQNVSPNNYKMHRAVGFKNFESIIFSEALVCKTIEDIFRQIDKRNRLKNALNASIDSNNN